MTANMVDTAVSSGPFPAFLAAWIQFLVPQPCFDTLFVDLDFLNIPCLKVVISKCLGFGIILGSVIVKVPQIVKLLKAKSGEGISLISVSCELLAISATWSYGFASKFPFSSYGEAVFLALQTLIIAFLVLFYTGQTMQAFTYVVTYVSVMVFLLSPYAPFQLLSVLQTGNAFVIMVSKLIQAVTNFQNKSTGQLSVITVFLLFVGAIARIFTSIQETGDNLVVFTYVVSTVFNGIIAAQMLLYWNADKAKKTKKE